MLALLALAAAHVCPIPQAAYDVVERERISSYDNDELDRYTMCVCGPEGANGAPNANGWPYSMTHKGRWRRRWHYAPEKACEHIGWNGHSYTVAKPTRHR